MLHTSTDLHGGDILLGGNPLLVEAQAVLHLLLHLVAKCAAGQLAEAVNPAGATSEDHWTVSLTYDMLSGSKLM